VKSKSLIGILIIGSVAAITWLVSQQIGISVLHGKTEFTQWRSHHALTYVAVWAVGSFVIALPILYMVGRRMLTAMTEHDDAVDASRGVGRLAVRALQGKTEATDKLVLLLKDQNRTVRCQAARALAFLDDDDVNPTLFKVVRYWPGPDKLALIEMLRRTQDVRCGKLLTEFTHDRGPNVSRKAMSALPIVMGRTWRGPTKAEDEARRAQGRGNRAAGQTGVPAALADMPARAELKKEDRPLISSTPKRTKPVAKPAGARSTPRPATGGAKSAAGPSAAASRPAPAKGLAPKPKPASERTEATPATEPAALPPA
jgi:hypothetical protein